MKTIKILYIAICLTAIGCSSESSPSPKSSNTDNSSFGGGGGSGKGGSLARFAVNQSNLYVVNDHKLFTYSLQDPTSPKLENTLNITAQVETIFPMNDYLLLGTQSGMEIYSISNPNSPAYVSRYNHIVSCDPVVAQNGIAYSTLRTGTNCNRGEDRLDIIDIGTITNPQLISSMVLSNPKGLGLSGNYLYVCDDSKIKGINVTSPFFPFEIGFTELDGCYDIISDENSLIVAASGGVSQYDVEENGDLSFISTISAK